MSGRLRLERLLPLACIAGGALLFASQFMNIFELNSAGPTAQKLIDSTDQHWYAMAILGLYAALAAAGRRRRGHASRSPPPSPWPASPPCCSSC